VERTLEALMRYEQGPFVGRLAREPGRRDERYAELFTTDVPREVRERAAPAAEAARAEMTGDSTHDRLDRLEQRVAALEAAIAAFSEGRGGRM